MNAPRKGGSRLVLVLLVIVFAAPVTVSWLLFRFTDIGRDGAAAGHGQLISPPRQLPDVALYNPADAGASAQLHGKWTLIWIAPAACDADCADALLRMRQLRLALGTNADRVQRLLLLGSGAPGAEFAAAWPGLLLLAGAAAESLPLAEFTLAPGDDPRLAGRLYLVDPRGFLMMSYAPDADPAGIIRDLKRLLRYSRIG